MGLWTCGLNSGICLCEFYKCIQNDINFIIQLFYLIPTIWVLKIFFIWYHLIFYTQWSWNLIQINKHFYRKSIKHTVWIFESRQFLVMCLIYHDIYKRKISDIKRSHLPYLNWIWLVSFWSESSFRSLNFRQQILSPGTGS